MTMWADMSINIGIFIILLALAGIIIYFGRRGKVFGFGGSRASAPVQLTVHETYYVESILGILSDVRHEKPDLGSMDFSDSIFIDLIGKLDSLEPFAVTAHYGQHRAYRDAVANFVTARRATVIALRDTTPIIHSITRDQIPDCRIALGARDLMATYSQSVDSQIEELLKCCESEAPAWEMMRQCLYELDVALYRLRFSLG